MRIDAIAIGNNAPEDINVIIEVPIGGEPIKYELDKTAGTLVVDPMTAKRLQLSAGDQVRAVTLSAQPVAPREKQ